MSANNGGREQQQQQQQQQRTESPKTARATVAYAVSVTRCNRGHMDGAAVLKHSIHLSSIRNPNSSSKYDYHAYAFMHHAASTCQNMFKRSGYTVLMRDTPVDLSKIKNTLAVEQITNTGCCGEKEFLKLHSFLLLDYPIVVHLDVDTLILKPLDDLFDVMLLPEETALTKHIPAAMWTAQVDHPVNAFFTRDYPMVRPGHEVEKVGVQGGFLVIRPDQSAFEELVSIIEDGHFVPTFGWGGEKLRYGGFHGEAQIQGLFPYFFGHLHPNTSVELNRCRYNQMADPPRDVKGRCYTGQDRCEDCRDAALSDVYSVHFTMCQKPWACPDPAHPKLIESWTERQARLCMEFHHEWHRLRYRLESSVSGSKKVSTRATPNDSDIRNYFFGHCSRTRARARYGYRYHPLNRTILGPIPN